MGADMSDEDREELLARTTDTPDQLCLRCGFHVNAATSFYGRETPQPGDVTLCRRCVFPMFFDDELKLRVPTVSEFLELIKKKEFLVAINALLRARAENPLPKDKPNA